MPAIADFPLLLSLVEAGLKGTLILLGGLAATALMRRNSASSRHVVWLTVLTALLLLPVAGALVPAWRILPAGTALSTRVAPASPAATDPAATAPQASPRLAADAAPADGSPLTSAPAQDPAPAPVDWKGIGLMVWAAGAAVLLLRLLVGVARVRRIARRARELGDDGWITLTDRLSRRLGVGRIVRLLRDDSASVPMTWGVFRPVVLLPEEADGWSSERRAVVLAHELAHVRRWDALTQWIAHLAVALYWFNPLVWIAARRLRQEREHACDDAVLETGVGATAYADHLLTIVRSLGTASGPAAALAMARRSQFEGRLLAILDSAVRRGSVSRIAAAATVVAALGCVVPLAAMRAAAPVAALPGGAEKTSHAPEPGRVAEPHGTDGARPTEPKRGTQLPPVQAGVSASQTQAGGTEPASPAGSAGGANPAPVGGGSTSALLQRLEDRPDPGLYSEIIRAAERIESDTERRLVLMALLERPDLSRENIGGIVAATRTMSSDTERRLVLGGTLEHRAFPSPSIPATFVEAVSRFSSETELRIVITGLFERYRVEPRALAALLRVVGSRTRSSTEQRLMLTTAAELQRLEGDARRAYLEAAGRIVSGTDRALALSALTRNGDAPTTAHHAATGGADNVWNADISLDLDGRDVTITAAGVVFGARRWDIRAINPGGRLLVEVATPRETRRVTATRGSDGRPVFTYTVNGARQAFDATGRSWMAEIIREFTGS